jgi:hypothetical protein
MTPSALPGSPIRDQLARAAVRLLAGEPLPESDRRLAVLGLQVLRCRLDRATRHAVRRESMAQRDALIRAAAGLYEGTRRARAMVLLADASRHGSTAWPRHRGATSCPAEIVGTVREHFWRAMKFTPSFPSSLRQIAPPEAGRGQPPALAPPLAPGRLRRCCARS